MKNILLAAFIGNRMFGHFDADTALLFVAGWLVVAIIAGFSCARSAHEPCARKLDVRPRIAAKVRHNIESNAPE